MSDEETMPVEQDDLAEQLAMEKERLDKLYVAYPTSKFSKRTQSTRKSRKRDWAIFSMRRIAVSGTSR